MKHLKPCVLLLLAALVSCKQTETTYYAVRFDPNGGQFVYGEAELSVAEGDRAYWAGKITPPNPKLAFVGWFREWQQINEWDLYNDVVTADIRLYAGWEATFAATYHSYGGVFHDNGGGTTFVDGSLHAGDRLWQPSNVTKPGYLFAGWYTDIDLTQPWDFINNTITGDVDLYAKWEPAIEGLTLANYPRVDGATSTRALNVMVACKLLAMPYNWSMISATKEYCVLPKGYVFTADGTFLDGHIRTSQTHGAMMNLIDGNVDIILRSTTATPDEKAAALAKGVTLVETPIALDAFVFLKNSNNPVKSLTVDQIRKIYTREITNWRAVGGNDAAMTVFTRPRNSGSEEALRELVMGDMQPAEFPEEQQLFSMAGPYWEIERNVCAIGYSFKNYKEVIMGRPPYEPVFAVEGIDPTAATLRNRTYPLTTEVYAIIRTDLAAGSTARKLYDWLQSAQSRTILEECGFTTM